MKFLDTYPISNTSIFFIQFSVYFHQIGVSKIEDYRHNYCLFLLKQLGAFYLLLELRTVEDHSSNEHSSDSHSGMQSLVLMPSHQNINSSPKVSLVGTSIL